MNCALRGVALFVCAAALHAQAQAPQQPPPGLETDWDIGAVLQEIEAHTTRVLQVLDKTDAQAWVAQGASTTYAEQLQSSREQARALAEEARALARNPQKLSALLRLHFRTQGLETMLGSLREAMRKYQSPAAAEALASLDAEGSANRDRLQNYIVNLAEQREQQFVVMDKEAQRCRGMLSAPVPSAQAAKRKK